HTRFSRDWSSDVCSSDLAEPVPHADPHEEAGVVAELEAEARAVGGAVALAHSGAGVLIEVAVAVGLAATGDDAHHEAELGVDRQIGRASCREREESWEGV